MEAYISNSQTALNTHEEAKRGVPFFTSASI